MRSFSERMRRLEALEATQQPELPSFLCLRADDWERLCDPALDLATRDAIAWRYGLGSAAQLATIPKIYAGFCLCSWDEPPGCCPVCE